MKKTINQIELLLYEINRIIDSLLVSFMMDVKYIGEISQLVIQNKSLSKDVNDILVQRSLKERSSTNKLRLLYIIDSLIKHIGKEFIQYVSPHIFRIFEEAYTLSDEENKINLFKLYYSWKYYLDSALIESLCSRFNFTKMKRDLQRDKPELIEKYDKYNENVRETLFKEANVINSNVGNSIQITQTTQANPSSVIHNTNTLSNRDTPIVSNVQPIPNTSSNFESKDLKRSFLRDLATTTLASKSKRGEAYLSDSLFSSQSSLTSSPVISGNSSDNEGSGYLKKKLNIPNIRKEAKKSQQHTQMTHDKKQKSEVDSKLQRHKKLTTSINQLQPGFPKTETLSQHESIPPRVEQYPNMINQSGTGGSTMQPMNINMQMINQQLLNWMHASGMRNVQNIPNLQNFQQMQNLQSLPDYIKNNVFFQNMLKAQMQQQAAQITKKTQVHSFYDAVNTFIITSPVKLSNSPNLFSSISKFFNDTIQENDLVKDMMKESKEIKTKFDLLKIKDFNSKESYKDLYKKLIDSLYLDIKNCCPMCGFRTKNYTKFTQHLDIHFYVNYIKRNSQKKVLYRKESSDKQSWIKGINQSNEISSDDNSNTFTQPSYMLNAVLFYQNDNYQMVSNKKISKISDNPEDNEQLIVPVQPNEEINCVYCGEEFKKKYIQKYHYWFYVNVVKLSHEEIKNHKEIVTNLNHDLQKNGFVLIHETCIEEFMNMVKNKETINFIKDKRTRE